MARLYVLIATIKQRGIKIVNKLIVSYIGDSCAEFLPLSFESILPYADKIIFVWGMEDFQTKIVLDIYKVKYPDKLIVIESKYDQIYKGQNGKQRNIYLKYVQKYYSGYSNLTLDPDEVVSDNFGEFV